MAKDVLLDFLKGQLKLCNSSQEIEEKMHEDINKFLTKRKKEARKCHKWEEISEKLANVTQEEEAAKEKAIQVEQSHE